MDGKFNCNIRVMELKKFTESFFESICAAHDFQHTLRVFSIAEKIGDKEGADMEILLAAALLHDVGHSMPGDHAENSGKIAPEILRKLNFPGEKMDKIIYAVLVYRYSKGKIPDTKEAKILQDADRIDALGAIGIMRTFAHGTRSLYHTSDPFCKTNRKLDDMEYSLDHFYGKLLKLPDLMHTKAGKEIASERMKFMLSFLNELERELG